MTDVVSAEDVQRVRRWECKRNGHDFEVVQLVNEKGPHSVLCSNCGESWRVNQTDQEQGVGEGQPT